ncbi:AraC family transcriptional regulator [Actinomadura madurae]|uniref:AraC family transcriptional regulator n=1 Tax=Actinomadura madurae TaxID=1993 RepID=UPI0020D25698|nr:AraC family transcriptional regulator [Actinomadura madurae]MCP9969167.1 helix-turn-helix domain-containing protein [Actinomadura madurae]MCP9981642.1 helix-turn-helix domain-containing protein [Actinomadura madurae]
MTSLDISPPLSAHQRIVSTDIDLLHDTVEPFAVGHDLQAIEPQVPLDGQVNALGLGAVNLVWVRYGGGGVIVDTPPTEGHFALCAPQAPMGVEYRATKTSETARRPPGAVPRRVDADEAPCDAGLPGHRHEHRAARRPPRRPPRTRPHRAAALPQGRAAIAEPSIIQSTWRYVCAILDTATERGGLHPLAARSLEDALLTAILLGLPHTGTATLAEEPGKAPHHLAGVIREWVEAHHHRPIGVSDIAAAVGVGVRQLQVICQDQWGMTPTQLLRGVRLDRARAALTMALPGPRTVSDVAEAAGYLHMSRFAAHYRQRFGETPTETLRRR